MPFSMIIALVIAVLVALVTLQNAQPVQVNFFSWNFQGSLVIVILLAFVVGLAMATLLSVPGRFRKSRELAECRKRLRELEREKEKGAPQQQGERQPMLGAPSGDQGTRSGPEVR